MRSGRIRIPERGLVDLPGTVRITVNRSRREISYPFVFLLSHRR